MTTSRDGIRSPTALIAAASTEEAARLFGPEVDHFVSMTYADIDGDDLVGVGFVGLAAGPGMVDAVRLALASGDPDLQLVIEVPDEPGTAEAVRTAIVEARASVQGVQRLSDRVCVSLSGAGTPTADQAWWLEAVFESARRTPGQLQASRHRLSTDWELAAVQERSSSLEEQVADLTAELGRVRRRPGRVASPRDERSGRQGPDRAMQTAARAPDRPGRPTRLRRRVLDLLGLHGARARWGFQGAVALAGLLLVVGPPVLFGVLQGQLGLLLGLAVSVVVLVVAGVGLGLLLVLGRPAPAPDPARDRVVSRRRHMQLVAQIRQVRRAQRNQYRRLQTMGKQPRLTRTSITRAVRDASEQVQASLNLRDLVSVDAALPTLGRFTASADLLVVLLGELIAGRPRVVVEAGSGVSTLFLALAAEQHGIETRIVALDHHRGYAEMTRALLEKHGVAHRAEVRHAPLARTTLAGHDTPWYDESALADLADVGLVLVDGPPAATGPAPRYPLVPLLRERFSPDCVILVDDTNRESDHDVVLRWREQLPDFELEELALEKGAMLMRRQGPAKGS